MENRETFVLGNISVPKNLHERELGLSFQERVAIIFHFKILCIKFTQFCFIYISIIIDLYIS